MVGDGETVYTLSDSSDDECANNEPAANCPPRCATLVQNKRQRTEQIERDAAYARALVNDEAADANDAASVALARTLQEAENAKAYSASSSGGGTSTSSNSGKHFTLCRYGDTCRDRVTCTYCHPPRQLPPVKPLTRLVLADIIIGSWNYEFAHDSRVCSTTVGRQPNQDKLTSVEHLPV